MLAVTMTSLAKHALLFSLLALAACSITAVHAQQPAAGAQATGAKPTHEDTEFYKPVPPVVTPAATVGQPPSDAVVL